MTPEERVQEEVDRFNRSAGESDDGYHCKKCMDRGMFAYVSHHYGENMPMAKYELCECEEIRKSIRRLRASGLEKAVREKTFDTFRVDTDWQRVMLEKAKRYAANGANEGRWFYAGGNPGSGKTHLCTAIARELLYRMPVLYVVWTETVQKLKAVTFDAAAYSEAIGRLKSIPVLIIDDLFKPVRDGETVRPPRGKDVEIAFEILNHRYVNRLPTILSSEWMSGELMDIDEATGSRVAEMCGRDEYSVSIARAADRNMRLRG